MCVVKLAKHEVDRIEKTKLFEHLGTTLTFKDGSTTNWATCKPEISGPFLISIRNPYNGVVIPIFKFDMIGIIKVEFRGKVLYEDNTFIRREEREIEWSKRKIDKEAIA